MLRPVASTALGPSHPLNVVDATLMLVVLTTHLLPHR